MKLSRRYTDMLFMNLILFLIIVVNSFLGLKGLSSEEIIEISGFSFWQYSFNYNLGTMITIISPIMISIASVTQFFREINTGFIDYMIVRKPYQRYLKKSLKEMYLKSVLFIPLSSLIILVISLFVFGSEIGTLRKPISVFTGEDPISFSVMTTMTMVLYSITVVNITIILARYINKFYLVLIALFMTIFFMGYIESNFIFLFIGETFNSEIIKNISFFDLYYSSTSHINWYISVFIGILRFLLTLIIVNKLYKNKEKLVLDNEK